MSALLRWMQSEDTKSAYFHGYNKFSWLSDVALNDVIKDVHSSGVNSVWRYAYVKGSGVAAAERQSSIMVV